MKKIFTVLFALSVTSAGAFAFVDNMYMTSEEYMQNTGFSKEMARMITVTNQEPYREVYKEPTDAKGIWRRIHNYLVPEANVDLDFYGHNGNYDNSSWKDFH